MTASFGARAATVTLTVTVTGAQPKEWNVGSFGLGSIIAPGNDFSNSTQTGPNPTVTINITGTPGNSTHTVSVSKAADNGTTWNSAYTLWIQPLDAGTGSGVLNWSIPTGTWTQITTAPAALQLFDFKQDRAGVTLQLQLQNLTVAAGTRASAPSFLTTLTYTYQ